MTKPVPINSINAIEASAVALIFNRQFTAEEDAAFQVLETELKSDYPSFARDMMVKATIEGDKVVEQSTQRVGVTLQHFSNDGKVTRILQIGGGQIVINCLAYDRWEHVWGKAKKHILAVCKLLDTPQLAVSAMALQYVDKFIQPSSGPYKMEDVFAKNSQYLTQKNFESGQLWHVHQGWFDMIDDATRILNVLNIGTLEQHGNTLTTIDHTATLQFKEPITAVDFLKEELFDDATRLHILNKKIIAGLLNKEQLTAIGM